MPADRLEALARIARQLQAEELAREAEDAAARSDQHRFYVACAGQFKRGKSTLINALLDDDLLPTGVVPVTSVITIVRWGRDLRPVVRFLDGTERALDRHEIADYVSEELNSANHKNVQWMEIQLPNALLESGMCLVDTPGLGSIFEASTQMTRRFVPHIDAAIIVLGADPPISGEEAALAAEMAREVPDLIFVLNKVDRLSESDVGQARVFCERTLHARLQRKVEILTVSAIHRTHDWNKLRQRLAALVPEDLVQAAERRATRRLTARILREIDERRRALTVPLEETERRLEDIQERIAVARRALDDLAFLFASEQQKLSRALVGKRDEFLSQQFADAADEEKARAIARDAIAEWSIAMEPAAQEMFTASTERFAALLRNLGDIEIERRLARSRFFFTALPELTGRTWFRKRNSQSYLRRLLETNSARLINDVIDRFVESRRALERDVAGALREVGSASERAARTARETLSHGRERVAEEVARLDALIHESSSLFDGAVHAS